jgi:nicotinamidase/pyrazinamidase
MGKDATPDFVESWPDHCVAGTAGAEYHPEVSAAVGRHAQAEFRKGRYEAAYSAFEGTLGEDDDESLLDWLSARKIEAVDIVGIATDYCVRATALDARSVGLHTAVLTDLVAGVAEDSSREALEELDRSGVHLATSESR